MRPPPSGNILRRFTPKCGAQMQFLKGSVPPLPWRISLNHFDLPPLPLDGA